jgi:hypothetical protein
VTSADCERRARLSLVTDRRPVPGIRGKNKSELTQILVRGRRGYASEIASDKEVKLSKDTILDSVENDGFEISYPSRGLCLRRRLLARLMFDFQITGLLFIRRGRTSSHPLYGALINMYSGFIW